VKILLVGLSHHSAPLELREQVAVSEPGPALQKLVACDEIAEAVLLSTCNRTEVVALTRAPEQARLRLRAFFRRDLAGEGADPSGSRLEAHLYEHADAEAMRHVMRVAASLDSMVLGEPQILGQAKEAWAAALECGACGPILGRLFQHAFGAAKRVRNETRIAERPVSMARVAVDLAKQIFESFEDKRAVLIGAGEMVEIALRSLRDEGLAAVSVVNRTPERAGQLAVRYGASAHGLDELPALLARADVVLSSIGGDGPVLTRAGVAAALRGRPQRPLFVIDLGVPRNAEPEIDELDNVYRYDVDDLGAVASENAELRQAERARAEAIVAEEQQRFDGWFTALRAVPTIQHLRARMEALRAGEVERALGRGQFAPEQREAVEALTRALVNKVLHAPVSRLRREAGREEGMATLEAARELFALDEPEDTEAGGEPSPEPSDDSGEGG
jgi:glutamyl-tRNA reductase